MNCKLNHYIEIGNREYELKVVFNPYHYYEEQYAPGHYNFDIELKVVRWNEDGKLMNSEYVKVDKDVLFGGNSEKRVKLFDEIDDLCVNFIVDLFYDYRAS